MPDFWTSAAASKMAAGLHLGDFGIHDAQSAPAETKHRVELVEFLHALLDLLDRYTHLIGDFLLAFRIVVVRQELVQWRIEEADGGRIALQGLEDAGEILLLVRQQLGERLFPVGHVIGEDHLAHGLDTVALEEHVLGAGQADARRAEGEGVLVCSGVSALVRTWRRVALAHQSMSVLNIRYVSLFFGSRRLIDQHLDDLGRRGRNLPAIDIAGGAVDGEEVAFLEGLALCVTVLAP